MDLKPKVKAAANISKNRLNISISGNVTAKSLDKLFIDIRSCVADLKNNFEVIENIYQCNLLYIESLQVYKKIINFLISNKVGEMIRIVKVDNISSKQIIKFSEKIHCQKILCAESEKEAEERLLLLIKRDGIRFRVDSLFFEYEIGNQKGIGSVIDISTSGCAIDSPTIPLSIGAELFVTLIFDDHKTLLSMFKIKAQVVRVNDQMFATQFLDFDDDKKELLYQRLAYEVSNTSCFN
jgi:hypothetical protein